MTLPLVKREKMGHMGKKDRSQTTGFLGRNPVINSATIQPQPELVGRQTLVVSNLPHPHGASLPGHSLL